MGMKAVIAMGALFAVAYPGTRSYGVQIACAATPEAMVMQAEAMMPVSPSFWNSVNGIMMGDFGAPPSNPLFLHLWNLEKSMAGHMASFLSAGKVSTFAQVCPSQSASYVPPAPSRTTIPY